MPTVTLSSSTFKPVVMIFAVGKSAALVVDFSRPGGNSTAAPVASVERSVAAGAAAFSAFADDSVAVDALEDLLHALLTSAAHKKAPGKTSDKAPRKPRLRLEKTDCMGVSIVKASLERAWTRASRLSHEYRRNNEPPMAATFGRSVAIRGSRIGVQSERVPNRLVDVDATHQFLSMIVHHD